MTKIKAKYTITLDKEGSEKILTEIDLLFIELEKKYPIEVETWG